MSETIFISPCGRVLDFRLTTPMPKDIKQQETLSITEMAQRAAAEQSTNKK